MLEFSRWWLLIPIKDTSICLLLVFTYMFCSWHLWPFTYECYWVVFENFYVYSILYMNYKQIQNKSYPTVYYLI